LERAAARPDDPLWANLRHDPRIGVLFVELGSRRRYRVNGRVADPGADPLVVAVAEALPNCPKYITRRHLVVDAADGAAPAAPARRRPRPLAVQPLTGGTARARPAGTRGSRRRAWRASRAAASMTCSRNRARMALTREAASRAGSRGRARRWRANPSSRATKASAVASG